MSDVICHRVGCRHLAIEHVHEGRIGNCSKCDCTAPLSAPHSGQSKSWPKTRAMLEAEGYAFVTRKQCSGRTCAKLVYWVTTPKGKSMPLSEHPDQIGIETAFHPHFADCPDVKLFKRGKS